MSNEDFDAIVVGAGLAGICCAGELVLQGARPLLICEANEVGFAVRPINVGGNRGIMQIPTLQVGWGEPGGWWGSLARRLNAPVIAPNGYGAVDYTLAFKGDRTVYEFPQTVFSAAGLTEALARVFPVLADYRGEFERVLHKGMIIPPDQLIKMNAIRIIDWLEDVKADELVRDFFALLAVFLTGSSMSFCRQHVSVYGWFGYLRSYFMGEANFGFLYPDNREGLAIPLARAMEQQGGTVWRGRKAARVDVSGGGVGSVIMADGQEVRAPFVAMACSNARIETLLDPLPPETVAPLTYTREIAHRDFWIFSVLNKPVIPSDARRWVGIVDLAEQSVSWAGAMNNLIPWSTLPGKQFVNAGRCFTVAEAEEHGGDEVILTSLHDMVETLWPGYKDAIEECQTMAHAPDHLWFSNGSVGPKLPRTSHSVQGLYFVNDSSEPTAGCFMDASASAGILGARTIAAAHRDRQR